MLTRNCNFPLDYPATNINSYKSFICLITLQRKLHWYCRQHNILIYAHIFVYLHISSIFTHCLKLKHYRYFLIFSWTKCVLGDIFIHLRGPQLFSLSTFTSYSAQTSLATNLPNFLTISEKQLATEKLTKIRKKVCK